MKRIFAVGDVHGCLAKLDQLLAKMKINPRDDTLVFVGDYMDRGDDSKGVVERLIGLREEYSKIIFLQGNHERLFLDYYYRGKVGMFLENGGRETIRSYGGDNDILSRKTNTGGAGRRSRWFTKDCETETIASKRLPVPEKHLDFFHSLPPFVETSDYIFVHAGLRPGVRLEEQDIEDLTWIRNDFIYSTFHFPKTVIFGHTVFPEPFIQQDRIGIDTGAVFGGKLTGLELPARKIYQV